MPKKAAKKKTVKKSKAKKAPAAKNDCEINILLADQVYLDSRSRKYLVAGLFQFIHTTKLPTHYPRFTMFVEVVGTVQERNCELSVISPSGIKLHQFTGRVRNYLAHDVFNLALRELGPYTIELKLDGKVAISRTFTVIQIEQKPAPAAPATGSKKGH
jgi:hypothetical protein